MKPEKKQVALSDDAKGVFELLKKDNPINLPQLKEQAGLSNKKWDKAIKELTSKKVAKVSKEAEQLMVSMV